MNQFYIDLKRGEVGEDKVISILKQRGHNIVDVRAAAEYQKADIDFLVDGRSCEVKTDYRIWETGNLFLEDYISYKSKEPYRGGFFRTSEAEYLFYIDIHNDVLYIYKMEELRAFAAAHRTNVKACEDSYKTTYGICLDKDLVRHQVIYFGEEQ